MQNLTIEQQNHISAQLREAYAAMKEAAIRLSTIMIALAPDETRDYLINATVCGAKLVLELGPLPEVAVAQVFLIEPEGKRQFVAAQKDPSLLTITH